MAQITSLQVTGLPGVIRLFIAKVEPLYVTPHCEHTVLAESRDHVMLAEDREHAVSAEDRIYNILSCG